MDTAEPGWWRRHGWTVALLFSAFGIALLVRILWMAPLIEQYGPLNLYGGGSDSFYHSRVMAYLIANHHNLVVDNLLKYPLGAVNPREPLFDWMNAVLGILFAGFFGGNATVAGSFFLDLQGPIWSALGVFPIYLIGKEVASKRVGIVAGFLYPLMVANIDSSTFGYANYLSFYTFVILVTAYCYLRTIKATGTRRFVVSYRHPRQIPGAVREFYRTERTSVKWAVLTGVSFGTLALAWQGYTFMLAAIVIFLFFSLIVERIRRVDSFGIYVNTWIVGLVGFPMAFPYYFPQGLALNWFGLPLVLFLGAMLVALPFVALRDTPWVVSIPILAALAAAALGALDLINHADFVNIVTGQGYFVKTLVYSTVAEAQAPSIDSLILGYGVVTFFLAFVGLGLAAYKTARSRFPRSMMFFLVFAIISIYLPISAAKFFFLGSAGFALLAADPLVRLLEVASYPKLRQTVGQLADRRSQAAAFRRAFKARHVLVMALVLVVVLPNVWYAIDAGVPYNSKSTYNQQIYNTLPPPLRTTATQAQSFYLGAAGTQLDTPTQYDEAGYNWLAGQDQNLPPDQRPAFISWWDYGFQAVAQGLHPTVADNFQNGIDPAGNFLLSQNESLAIGILTTTLLNAEATKTGDPYLPSGLNQILAHDGVNLTQLHTLLANVSADVPIVLAHPDRYLAVDPNNIDGTNAMFDTVSYLLASTLSLDGVAQVYDDVEAYTHWSIRYAMVDSRLFPTSGSNTGIFYAPADLTDRVIGSGGAPTSYFTLSVLGSDGNTYAVSALPSGVTAVQYNINYLPAFYDSMIYRIFVGYNGTDIGSGAGIPGLSGSVGNDPIQPGWMMRHFEVVYQTAYYCPYSDPAAHPGCYAATNTPTAEALAKAKNGSVSTSPSAYYQGGEAMLEYFPGQTMTGTVTLPSGAPVAGVRVTVDDGWGIPHDTVLTSADGAYSVLLPPGNDTVNLTMGALTGLSQQGATNLLSFKVVVPQSVGAVSGAPTLVRPVVLKGSTVSGFVYWNTANNSTYESLADTLIPGANVTLWGAGGPVRQTTTDASGAYVLNNVAAGVYNVSVSYRGSNFTEAQLYATPGGAFNKTFGLSAAKITGTVYLPSHIPADGAVVTVTSANGVVGTATTNLSGEFLVPNIGRGNLTVSASLAASSLGSSPASITVLSAGGTIKQNLTLVPFVTLQLAVVLNGNPVPAFPVRFSPIGVLSQPSTVVPKNGSAGSTVPPSSSPALSNASVFLTNANGFVTATLPADNYSVYGFGLVGAQLYAGLSDAYVPSGSGVLALAPLVLGHADRLSGPVSGGQTTSGVAVPTEILAFDSHGDQAVAFANGTGGYNLALPSGTYTILAVQGLTTSNAGLAAQLLTVSLTGDLTLPISLVPAIPVHLRLGTTVGGALGLAPAAAASVKVTLVPTGATVTALADGAGNVSFVVPASVPVGASFCLSASALGFASYDQCGLAPTGLGSITTVPLALQNVPVNLTVVGMPGGTTLTLNVTAESPTAKSVTLTGGPTFALNLTPGSYQITGWGKDPSGGLILPSATVNTSIPLGSVGTNVTIVVLHQVPVTGSLLLPSGLTSSAVSVRLLSTAQNLSLSGAAYVGKFLAAPGNYTVYAAATGAAYSYATVVSIDVSSTGKVSAPLNLTGEAGRLTANLTQPDGAPLNATFPVLLTGPGGLTIPTNAFGGSVHVTLPANTSWGFVVNTTQLVPTGTGTAYETFHAAAGGSCPVVAPSGYCRVALTSSALLSEISGHLAYPGYPTPLVGNVTFVGPSPSTSSTTVEASDGSFSASLAPGSYEVYATAGGAAFPVANLSEVTIGPTATNDVTLTLTSTWTDSVTVLAPAGGTTGLATVTFRAPGGATITFPNEPFGSVLSVALPQGIYTVSASAPANPYGVPTNATASASLVLLGGNAATTLSLAYHIVQTATMALLAPVAVTLGNGGVATFSFTVTNTGNAPETLHFVGSPLIWNFSFSPPNVTLGTSPLNDSAGGTVRITIPAGTAVAHPTIQLEAELPNDQPAGFVEPLPIVTLTPVYGLVLGSMGSTGASSAPFRGTAGFFVHNPGTISESVALTIVDLPRIELLGWTAKIQISSTVINGLVNVAAGANQSYTVLLTAPAGHAEPPGTVTVAGMTANGTVSATTTLTINVNTLTLNQTSLAVTGPSIGAPPAYPDWLVPLLSFTPAIALVVALLVNRYLKTRRWSRR